MKLSIALCTCNSARFLQEQLDSIANQSYLPDELVVCDDALEDSTLRILKAFRQKAKFRVRIYRNTQRLGVSKNFEKAISLCKGNYIALSDSDDVWLPEKLEKLMEPLERDASIGYVFSNALVVDEKLNPLGYTFWDAIGFTLAEQEKFAQGKQVEVLVKRNVVQGPCMAFRAELKEVILPIPQFSGGHDAWISLIASCLGMKGCFIREPLMLYRLHPSQVWGFRVCIRPNFSQKVRESLGPKIEALQLEELRMVEALKRLASVGKLNTTVKQLLENKIQHLRNRRFIQTSRRYKRPFYVLREILTKRYHTFSAGWISVAKDLLL